MCLWKFLVQVLTFHSLLLVNKVKEDSIVMEKIPFTQKGRKVVEKEAETFEIKLEDIKTATVCFEI